MDVYQYDSEKNVILHDYPNPALVYHCLIISGFGLFFCILS